MREYFAVAFEKPCGGFVVEFPDFPDCVAFARSREAARVQAVETLVDYIAEMKVANEPIPEPSSYTVIRYHQQNIGCDIIRIEIG